MRVLTRSSTSIIKADSSVVFFFCKDLFISENFGGDMRVKLRGTHEQCFKNGVFRAMVDLMILQ